MSLAGVCDLAVCFRLRLGDGAAGDLMGGGPDSFPGRYLSADPMQLLPSGLTVRLVHGAADDRVPAEQSRSYAWPAVLAAFRSAAAGSGLAAPRRGGFGPLE